MGEFIGQLLIEVLLSVVEYPGAFIHWLLRKKQMPFKEIEERYFGINLLLSLIVYAPAGYFVFLIV